jgi:predicted DNA-binding protein
LCYTFSSALKEGIYMPAKNPRINVVLEEPLYREVQFLAKKDGVSMSTKVRDLLKELLDTQEDIYLARIADRRSSTWKKPLGLSHEETWK